MKAKLVLLFVFVSLYQNSFGQFYYSHRFINKVTFPNWTPFHSMWEFALAQTPDSNFYILHEGIPPNSNYRHTAVLKCDQAGRFLWAKDISFSNENLMGEKFIPMYDNGCIIAGLLDYGNNPFYGIFFLRMDAFGNILWSKIVNNSGGRVGLHRSPDGTNILCGSAGTYSSFAIKFDDNGNIIWSKEVHYPEFLIAIAADSIGNLVFCGSSTPDTLHVLKMDVNGNLLWINNFRSLCGYVTPLQIEVDRSENIFVLGEDNSGNGGFGCAYLLKLNRNGGLIWDKSYSYPMSAFHLATDTSMVLCANGLELLKTDSTGTPDFINSFLAYDPLPGGSDFIPTYDKGFATITFKGTFLKTDNILQSSCPYFPDSIISGNLFPSITHYGYLTSGPGTTSIPLQTAVLTANDSAICHDSTLAPLSVQTYIDEPFTVNVFPNPATNFINYQLKGDAKGKMRIEITNTNGEKLLEQYANTIDGKIYLGNFPPAVYFIRFSGDKFSCTSKIVLVKRD